ncbi:hypothetical protein [Variovorax sp. Root411]|uniref:hypothetical protein n=1 Tax=Variovorax sp. Root411 TaxID=1736530 RepID=UPI000AE702A9|nr:hypothetical protein [Variovorax sp. Root411]
MPTESTTSLFANPTTVALLRRLAQDVRARSNDDISPPGLSHVLLQILELMISSPTRFDEYAGINVEWIGNSFLGEIGNYFEAPPDARPAILRSIFTSAYRFICELEFTQPGEASFEIHRIMNFVHDNLDGFTGTDRQQLVYASYAMPAQVTKKLLGHPSIAEFRQFSETIEKSRKLREEWDKNLKERLALLEGLEANINKLTSEYNFVGLVHGFQKLKEQKEDERKFSFKSLITLAIAMALPPLIQLGFVTQHIDLIESHKTTLAYTLPTILATEVILIYFFRVVLSQFRSVKTQLLQIDLRISLCQFIESFAEYASKARDKGSTALSKFESLIFSSLVTDEAGIPSTFDGAEQIANLIRSVRGGDK